VYRFKGEIRTALNKYEEALRVSRTLELHPGRASILSNIGYSHYLLSEYDRAIDYLNRALLLNREFSNRAGEAITMLKLGVTYRALLQMEVGREHCRHALVLSQAVGDPMIEASALDALAEIEQHSGNLIKARELSELSLTVVESVRRKAVRRDLQATLLGFKRVYYLRQIDILMASHGANPTEGFNAEAFQISERARARSLVEMLTEARVDIRQGVDPVLLEREHSVQQRLNAKEQERLKLLNGTPSGEQKAAAEGEIRDLLTEYQELQAKIRIASPGYAALTQPQPLGLREIQQQVLDKDTLLLEYALGAERSYLFAVTKDSLSTYELPKRSGVEDKARQVLELMTARNQRVTFEEPGQWKARVAKADAEFAKAAADLSRIILAPAAHLLSKKRLLVVADGALQYIPFAAIPSPQPAKGKVNGPKAILKVGASSSAAIPLGVRYEIVSIPSASALAVLRRELARRSPARRAVAVLADPVFGKDDERVKSLVHPPQTIAEGKSGQPRVEEGAAKDEDGGQASPDSHVGSIADFQMRRSAQESGILKFDRLRFTRHEAERIAALVPRSESKKALDFAANRETATTPVLSQYRIVHFATHGLLNSVHPELSGLVFSLVNEKGEPQDGFLRLHDIYNLNLPAELVVLSACKTGLGKEIKGEGLIGLTRGFMYAGAKNVVVSLWDVNDAATAELMAQFYRGMLKKKMRPAAALRAAQLSLKKEKRWSAPYYWAGFQIQGEYR
ncbi:MAG: CHAT domain-containing protein, partial [Acidobacteria bacterium]|nr:CHAT domain-containing protein [Acidobacteriota bacterium]